ncbi:hypothetical protein M422DRAFT_56094 [Sphaerobolus stellatus SS14]|uniref:YEATS domain-containing protein n=1 Tax=Sphaerobolus stellatus (strain SS14) TaxID=990650 RepID=A0A0C9T854_SPHS4|nr:hypothetical protein M422DRAFT_56094 [Sphaerobolus stellatus SS14]
MTDTSVSSTFRDAALAAYEAIESSCLIITSNQSSLLKPLTSGRPPPSAPPPPIEAPRTRKRVNLGLAQPPTVNGPLLFEDKTTKTTVKLVCPDCSRSDFPTMQGFLNHCRLAHTRLYGTHDECIQDTGVPIDDAERVALAATGVEVSTVHLPSIRGMFERAVGLGLLPESSEPGNSGNADVSTHLSQTLGLHKDSPTLAPFLGKEVKKKVIHVYDEPDPVDIFSVDEDSEKPRKPLFKRYKPNNGPNEDESMNAIVIAETERAIHADVSSTEVSEINDPQLSRFHVTRRVNVTDRSLFLPENKRSPIALSHTHRWQLTVSAPSYSQHITTFLDHFSVTCVTQPSVFSKPILISGPPFVACSTTDRPFLARLTLHWVGEQNHPFDVYHWVEIDQFRSARIAHGEDQIFDIELDKSTQFAAARDVANTLPWNGDADYQMPEESVAQIPGLTDVGVVEKQGDSGVELQHIKLLKKIVQRFPIVSLDLTRQPSSLPYSVQPSRSKLLGLVPGRRKAIEWARALAIRNEYDSIQASSSDVKVPLTTASIYRWLDANGHFPRPLHPITQPILRDETSSSQGTPDDLPPASPRYCPVCGVNVQYHNPPGSRGINYYRQPVEQRIGEHQCPAELERRKAPVLHVYTLLPGVPYWNPSVTLPIPRNPDYGYAVKLVDPQLTRFVRRVTSSLPLPCLQLPERETGTSRIEKGNELALGSNAEEINDALAPHALLAMVVERVVKDLVNNGLQVAREMQGRAKSNTTPEGARSIFTPTHVLQSFVIKDASQGGGRREALSKCFSRIGTVLQMEGTATGGQASTT